MRSSGAASQVASSERNPGVSHDFTIHFIGDYRPRAADPPSLTCRAGSQACPPPRIEPAGSASVKAGLEPDFPQSPIASYQKAMPSRPQTRGHLFRSELKCTHTHYYGKSGTVGPILPAIDYVSSAASAAPLLPREKSYKRSHNQVTALTWRAYLIRGQGEGQAVAYGRTETTCVAKNATRGLGRGGRGDRSRFLGN